MRARVRVRVRLRLRLRLRVRRSRPTSSTSRRRRAATAAAEAYRACEAFWRAACERGAGTSRAIWPSTSSRAVIAAITRRFAASAAAAPSALGTRRTTS